MAAQGWEGKLELTDRNETPLRPLESMFTSEIQDKIRSVYGQDFETFGYDGMLPNNLHPEGEYEAAELEEVRRLIDRAERMGDLAVWAAQSGEAARQAAGARGASAGAGRASGGHPEDPPRRRAAAGCGRQSPAREGEAAGAPARATPPAVPPRPDRRSRQGDARLDDEDGRSMTAKTPAAETPEVLPEAGQRLKIRFLIANCYGVGGTIKATLDLAGELAKRHDVEIVSVQKSRATPAFPVPPGVRLRPLHDRTKKGLQGGRGKRAFLRRLRSPVKALLMSRPSRLIHKNDARYQTFNLMTDVRLMQLLRSVDDGILIGTRAGLNLAIASVRAPLGDPHRPGAPEPHEVRSRDPQGLPDVLPPARRVLDADRGGRGRLP